jgi:predicted membrane protein
MKPIKNKVLKILFSPIAAIIFLIGWVLAWIGGNSK